MKITITAFLLAERDVKINHGLKKSQGKSKKSQGKFRMKSQMKITCECVNGEFLKNSLFNYSLLITDYSLINIDNLLY